MQSMSKYNDVFKNNFVRIVMPSHNASPSCLIDLTYTL